MSLSTCCNRGIFSENVLALTRAVYKGGLFWGPGLQIFIRGIFRLPASPERVLNQVRQLQPLFVDEADVTSSHSHVGLQSEPDIVPLADDLESPETAIQRQDLAVKKATDLVAF